MTASDPLRDLGFIGLGQMGGAMVRTLLRAGYAVLGFDIDPERLAASARDGAAAAESNADVVRRRGIVLTSLRSSAIFVEVAEKDLVPNAREGQVFIDLGTVAAPEARRVAKALAAKGATLLDCPVSGGPQGSETGTLHIFVGGDEAAAARCRPLLETLGKPERTVYCGPSGSGQVAKAVNQLAMGLGDAGYLEAIALGVRAGVDPAALKQAVGGESGWRAHFAALAQRVIDGTAETCWVKFPEFPYFLAEARDKGIPTPIMDALHAFLSAGDVSRHDNMGRPTASFWHELTTRRRQDDPLPPPAPV